MPWREVCVDCNGNGKCAACDGTGVNPYLTKQSRSAGSAREPEYALRVTEQGEPIWFRRRFKIWD